MLPSAIEGLQRSAYSRPSHEAEVDPFNDAEASGPCVAEVFCKAKAHTQGETKHFRADQMSNVIHVLVFGCEYHAIWVWFYGVSG